jgi:hypothetical protein
MLNKLGFNRHTPLAVALGPSLNLRLSLRDLPTEQGIALMVMIVRHLRSKSDQGRLLFIALSWWQLVMGTSYPLLQRPQRPILYDDAHIMSATRQFLKTVHGTLHIPELSSALPVPFRAQDQCLMDHFSLLPGATRATLGAANRVRLFYGVAYLSEITTADGMHLAGDAWEGTRLRISPLLWPFQPKPGPKSFRAWRRFLNDAFLRGPHLRVSSRTRDLLLRTTLGSWLPASSAFMFHWDALYAPSTTTLYVVSADGVAFDIHASRRTRRRPKHPVLAFSSRPCGQCPTLPPDAVPADYAPEPNKLVIPPVISQIQPPPAPEMPPLTWDDYVSSLPRWEQFLCRHVIILDRTLLSDCLRHAAHLCLASDGGAADCQGSYGYDIKLFLNKMKSRLLGMLSNRK